MDNDTFNQEYVDTKLAELVRGSEAKSASALQQFVTDRLTAQSERTRTEVKTEIDALLAKLDAVIEEANKATAAARPALPKKLAGKQVKGLTHKTLEDLMHILQAKLHPLLVGPAGSGKSLAAQQCADALGLKFYVQSVGGQTSMAHIFGYKDATGTYHETHFRTAYENGGVFCMDEIDAGNANVLVGINSALSNNLCAFPDDIVPMHKDFYMVATANTIGRGANYQYTGRNRLDEATLDRFVNIFWDYDTDLERILGGDTPEQLDWSNYVWKVRDFVEKNEINVVISTRAIIKGSALIPYFSRDRIIELVILNTIPQEFHKAIKAL